MPVDLNPRSLYADGVATSCTDGVTTHDPGRWGHEAGEESEAGDHGDSDEDDDKEDSDEYGDDEEATRKKSRMMPIVSPIRHAMTSTSWITKR